MEGRNVDVIEMEEEQNKGIEEIREIIEKVRYRKV